MLAHVAFWDEAAFLAITTILRGQDLPDGWVFGSGYNAPEDGWPGAKAHNAREAEWARGQAAEDVLSRAHRAHQRFVGIVATVTDAEAENPYYQQPELHYRHHQPELDSLLRND